MPLVVAGVDILVIVQGAALALLLARLLPGAFRRPPVAPRPEGLADTTVTVMVPCFNEAQRIGPCLAGLAAQGAPVHEILVVDSGSTDGTRELVAEAAQRDARIRLLTDPPLPPGWVGKVWALQHGLSVATGEWILGIDADTSPRPGLAAAVVLAAREAGDEVVSFAPRFAGMTAAEQWLQPSMLLTLVYRFGAAGRRRPPPGRVMANGQCFLARAEVLRRFGGYEAARGSWADDVSLARHLAQRGVSVGFLDGSRLYDVRAYESLSHMWREWGRSFDLSDATTRVRQWFDVTFIALVQGLPLPLLVAALATGAPPRAAAVWVPGTLLTVRCLMLGALWGSYARHTWGFLLSPLADPVAAVRLLLSTVRRPTQWRGRALSR
ncbi:MAG: glycosyltransferase [Gemmatimonadetes bacterium]|nr:glycosyltransferase [Gemmatimonadota bacterium]